MVDGVEGPWKNFTFKLIQEDDIESVLNCLRVSYYFDERISELMGFSQQYVDDLDIYYRDIFAREENLSFVAVDNDTGKIAGVQINVKKTEQDSSKGKNSGSKYKSWHMKVLSKIVTMSNEKANVWEHYGSELNTDEDGIKIMGKFDTSVTIPEFRNQGLAKEMYRRSFILFKSKGFTVGEGLFTSQFTRRIGESFGFEERARIYLAGLDLTDIPRDKQTKNSSWSHNASKDDCLSHMCIKLF